MRIWKSPLAGYLIIFCTLIASSASAETCLAPPRPFAPNDPALAREFRDLIKEDFENYLSDITLYFRWSCPAYVPVSQLIYAAFRSKAKGLLPPRDE
jgi:hypothetical protein